MPWLDGPTALAADDRALGNHDAGDDRVCSRSSGVRCRWPSRWPPSTGSPAVGWSSPSARAPPRRTTTASASTSRSAGRRLDESIGALRALWRSDGPPFAGRFYSTAGVSLDPHPTRREGPPIWVGSWGSDAGLRRTARLADGWLASAYNTTPTAFGEAWARLRELLSAHGKDPDAFPNALATMWFHITDSRAEADRVMQERLVPTIHRPEELLRERLPVGPAEMFAEKLSDFARAGVQRVFVWPVVDEAHQLERFWEEVRPAVDP